MNKKAMTIKEINNTNELIKKIMMLSEKERIQAFIYISALYDKEMISTSEPKIDNISLR